MRISLEREGACGRAITFGGERVEQTLHAEMKRFVDDVTGIVREGGGEAVVTGRVASRLEPLLEDAGRARPAKHEAACG